MAKTDEIGRKSALRRFLGKVAAKFGCHYLNMYYGEKDLEESVPDVRPSIDLQVSQASDDDLQEVLNLLDDESMPFFQYSIDMGSTCFVARSGGKIAGYSWCNLEAIKLFSMTLAQLPDNVGYTSNSYVFPEFRGKKIFQCLTRAVYAHLKSCCCRYVCNLVNQDNVPSIRARERLGARFQSVRVVKLPRIRPIILGRRFVIGQTK